MGQKWLGRSIADERDLGLAFALEEAYWKRFEVATQNAIAQAFGAH